MLFKRFNFIYQRILTLSLAVIYYLKSIFFKHFQIQGEALYKPGAFWYADNNINEAKQATKEAEDNGEFSDVTAMSWWCNQGGGGTAGIAYVGTLCMGDGYNTNLNEGDSSKAVSGYVSLPVFTHMYDVISSLSMIQPLLWHD